MGAESYSQYQEQRAKQYDGRRLMTERESHSSWYMEYAHNMSIPLSHSPEVALAFERKLSPAVEATVSHTALSWKLPWKKQEKTEDHKYEDLDDDYEIKKRKKKEKKREKKKERKELKKAEYEQEDAYKADDKNEIHYNKHKTKYSAMGTAASQGQMLVSSDKQQDKVHQIMW